MMLQQAIVYAKVEPQSHIDNVYRQVCLHIKGEVEEDKGWRIDRTMRKMGKKRLGRKRYRYAHAQARKERHRMARSP
jgi:hypothetical protein